MRNGTAGARRRSCLTLLTKYRTGMAVAALALSMVSIVIAVTSVVHARRQAVSTEQMASNDADRRRLERVPDLVGEIEPVNDGAWHRLRLRLLSDEALTGLTVEIIDGHGVAFTGSQNGVDSSSPYPIQLASWGSLSPSETACWRVQLGEQGSTELWLLVTCRGAAAKDRWTRTLKAEAPVGPPRG